MMIHLSKSVEDAVRSLVESGRFASVDAAMEEAADLLLKQAPPPSSPMTREEFDQHLLRIGLLSRLPDAEFEEDEPEEDLIEIRGEPLSETVIRERR